jgi:TM2 domain-containing membrane protein YozV
VARHDGCDPGAAHWRNRAHKFYLGQTGLGVVYLLFCWTFIPALIALIEGILFLTMSEQAFAQRHPG